MPRLKSMINGFRLHYKKDALGYIDVFISGKSKTTGRSAKSVMQSDKRKGGWHFFRKYGNRTHAYNCVKGLLEEA